MGSIDDCNKLLVGPNSIVKIDLVELVERPINELLVDARELYNNMRVFERQCLGLVQEKTYNFTMSMYHFALLKLSTALEDKLKNNIIEDEFVKFVLRYYTQDEKDALRELDKFSKLDQVIEPKELADVIVQGRGEIYKLVKEAVEKEYVDLTRVIKTWESQLKIRNYIAQAFKAVYYRRFSNIINAVQILLNQQPAWLKRLFEEYGEALLESAEARKRFEEAFQQVFNIERVKLEEAIKKLEEENSTLRLALERITSEIALTEDERKRRDEELLKIKAEYESLVANYEKLLEDYNSKLAELENLKRILLEKEHELEKLRNSEKTSKAEKIALENEIMQLRSLIAAYEKQSQEYKVLETRLKELESAVKEGQEGNLVRKEESEYFFEVVSGRARRILESGEISLIDARTNNRKSIKKWDSIERKNTFIRKGITNLTARSIIFTKLRGLWPLSKQKDIVVEYALFTHFTEQDDMGYDAKPLDVSELAVLIRDRAEEAETNGYYHVLIAVSPTGFTKTLVGLITGEKSPWTGATSKYMTVYLVDVVKGKTYYNQNDPVSASNSFLAILELSEEQLRRVVSYLRSREARLEAMKNNPTVNFLRLEEIRQATGVSDELTIRRALSILEEEGVGKVRLVNKELVFIYT